MIIGADGGEKNQNSIFYIQSLLSHEHFSFEIGLQS